MAYTSYIYTCYKWMYSLRYRMYREQIYITWRTGSPQESVVGFDLTNSRAEPLTPRRTINLASMYVPQTIFDKSNISGGVCVRISCSTFCAELTSKAELQLIDASTSSIAMFTLGRLAGSCFIFETSLHLPRRYLLGDLEDVSLLSLLSCSLIYILPAAILADVVTDKTPSVPDLSWGQLDSGIILKPIFEVREKTWSTDSELTVRNTSLMRILGEGWRSVRPICLPVQYKRRQRPGRRWSQF